MLRLTRDADVFHINAADCGPDCSCGRHTARAADRTREILAAVEEIKQLARSRAENHDQERRQVVSDADIARMPISGLIRLQAPQISPSQEEVWLAGRATRELHRRYLLTGDTKDPDPIDVRQLSRKELIRCCAPRVERATDRQSNLAKRALTELFCRQHGGT